MNNRESSIDYSVYSILASAEILHGLQLYVLMLHCSAVIGRGNKEMIVRNSLHIWQTSGWGVLPLSRRQRPLWHHQGVISRTVCFRTPLVKSESSERSKLRTSPIFARVHWQATGTFLLLGSSEFCKVWEFLQIQRGEFAAAQLKLHLKQNSEKGKNVFIFSKWIETTQKYEATFRGFFFFSLSRRFPANQMSLGGNKRWP